MRPLSSLAALAVTVVACSKLTAPPSPEPIASEAPRPRAALSGAPSAAPPALKGALDAMRKESEPAPTPAAAQPEGKLEIVDLKVGTGPLAKPGDVVEVHYTGTLKSDGKKFDSSRDRGQPAKFRLGEVIEGWNKGVPGMKVGGKRKLVIPYSMAYGEMGRPPVIPPKADLVFEIELVSLPVAPAGDPHGHP